MTKHLVPFAAWWCALFLMWLVLVDTFDGLEMGAGAAASMIAAVAAELVRSLRLQGLRPGRSHPARWWRLPVAVVADTGVMFHALWRDLTGAQPIRGAFRAVPSEVAGGPSMNAARRAGATFRISVTPNTYVVDFDEEEELVLVHELVPHPPTEVASTVERAL